MAQVEVEYAKIITRERSGQPNRLIIAELPDGKVVIYGNTTHSFYYVALEALKGAIEVIKKAGVHDA